MAKLQPIERKVYLAPTAKRHYLTRKAAANAEARALIRRKYPSERSEPDVGFRGWHWSEDERLVRVHNRLSKRILQDAGRQALEAREP